MNFLYSSDGVDTGYFDPAQAATTDGMRQYVDAAFCRRASGILALLAAAAPAFGGLTEGIAAFDALDYATAIEELTPLAEAGDIEAMYYLACLRNPQYEGVYVKKFADIVEAKRWYGAAAKEGHAPAMFYLGRLLEHEGGWSAAGTVPRRTGRQLLADAFPRLKARAEAGDGLAALLASRIRPGSHGTLQLLALSRELLEKDARRGDATAQLHLAEAYLRWHDLSVRQDAVKAFAWATLSLRNGNRHALIHQRVAAELLRERQYERAEALAALLIKDPAAPYPDSKAGQD